MFFMCLGIIFTANAQTLNIVSCAIQEGENIAANRSRYDLNENIAAVVVFTGTGGRDMDFRGNIIGDVIKEDSRYIVYLADRTKRLHIYCTDCVPAEIDFTKYADSEKGVLGGKTYSVSLVLPVKSKDYGTGSNVLVFESDVELKKVLVNNEEWQITGNTAKRLVPFGKYYYEIQSVTNKTASGEVEVVNMFGNQKVKIEFE